MKFKKVRLNCENIESDIRLVENNVIRNGVIDVSKYNAERIIEILDRTTTPALYVHDNIEVVEEVRNNSVYELKWLMTGKNLDELIGMLASRRIKMKAKVLDLHIDLGSMNTDQLEILTCVKGLAIEKYYSENPYMNVFVCLSDNDMWINEEYRKEYLEKLEGYNRNDFVGMTGCSVCPGYGICPNVPEWVDKEIGIVGTIFNDDDRCRMIRALSESEDEKYLLVGRFRDFCEAVGKDLQALNTSIMGSNDIANTVADAMEALLEAGMNEDESGSDE